jgi:hypothetical protein
MDKNADSRTPSAAAVVELLRPWCDASATKDLAGATPTSSSMYYRGGRPTQQAPALEETASFVLDEAETAPGQVDSPSQISQGTVSMAGETEDTLPHLSSPRCLGLRPVSELADDAAKRRWRVAVWVALAAVACAVIAALAKWVF